VSRSSRDIIDQIRELTMSGFAEIVLTGVDIGNWSDGKAGLAKLLERILASTDVKVLRLSSLEPPGLTDELIEVFCTNERIAPHLHIPIQSGSEREKRIKEIDRNNRMSFAKKFVGKILDFIPERVTGERVFGHSLNYLKVVAQGSAKRGEISKVLVEDFAEMTVFGKVLSDVE